MAKLRGFTAEDAATLFAQADVNEDGMLDYAEFARWLYEVSEPGLRDQLLKADAEKSSPDMA